MLGPHVDRELTRRPELLEPGDFKICYIGNVSILVNYRQDGTVEVKPLGQIPNDIVNKLHSPVKINTSDEDDDISDEQLSEGVVLQTGESFIVPAGKHIRGLEVATNRPSKSHYPLTIYPN